MTDPLDILKGGPLSPWHDPVQKAAAMPGAIHQWKTGPHQKQADGSWKPVKASKPVKTLKPKPKPKTPSWDAIGAATAALEKVGFAVMGGNGQIFDVYVGGKKAEVEVYEGQYYLSRLDHGIISSGTLKEIYAEGLAWAEYQTKQKSKTKSKTKTKSKPKPKPQDEPKDTVLMSAIAPLKDVAALGAAGAPPVAGAVLLDLDEHDGILVKTGEGHFAMLSTSCSVILDPLHIRTTVDLRPVYWLPGTDLSEAPVLTLDAFDGVSPAITIAMNTVLADIDWSKYPKDTASVADAMRQFQAKNPGTSSIFGPSELISPDTKSSEITVKNGLLYVGDAAVFGTRGLIGMSVLMRPVVETKAAKKTGAKLPAAKTAADPMAPAALAKEYPTWSKLPQSKIKKAAKDLAARFAPLGDWSGHDVVPETPAERAVLISTTLFTAGSVATVRNPARFDDEFAGPVGGIKSWNTPSTTRAMYQAVHDFLEHAGSLGPKRKTLYRGLKLSRLEINRIEKQVLAGEGPIIDLRSIASFSTSLPTARLFAGGAGAVLQPAVPIRGLAVADLSYYKQEREVIVGGLTKARITSVMKDGNTSRKVLLFEPIIEKSKKPSLQAHVDRTFDSHLSDRGLREKHLQTQVDRAFNAPLAPRLQPPGKGWAPIPGGKHGGFRKHRNGRFDYWYPIKSALGAVKAAFLRKIAHKKQAKILEDHALDGASAAKLSKLIGKGWKHE